MWYWIAAAAGVVLGLGILIFVLLERSARHAAQRNADEAQRQLKLEIANHQATQELLTAAKSTERRSLEAQGVLQNVLDQVRTRLASCRDPKVVKSWLESEMKDNQV